MTTAPSIRLLTLFLGGLLLAGCAPKPPPDFYVLNTAAPTSLPGFEQGVRVGVGPVETPPYLERNQIVRRESGTKLNLSEQSQWAEPVKAGLTRVLLVNLGLELDSNRIYALPMRQHRPLDYQIPIDVLRFDGSLGPGKEAVLGARWTVLSGDGKRVLVSKVSRIEEPVNGTDVGAFVEAQSRSLAKLSAEIASAIKEAEQQPAVPSLP
nr:membrane integrity-associated transporter subunit PqiC [Gammaproteobacteria bacterium]